MKFPSLSSAGCLAFMTVILTVCAKDVDVSTSSTTEHNVLGQHHQQGLDRASSSLHASSNTSNTSNTSSRFLDIFSSSTVAVEPTTGCEDTTLDFPVGINRRNCAWVAERANKRCRLLKGQVRRFCPETCGKCGQLACTNPSKPFYVGTRKRTCRWVKKKKNWRCKINGIASTCRMLCSEICKWPVVNFVDNPCTDIFGLGQCEACTGDCDDDNDCVGDMRCAQRYAETDTVENIPGCRWGANSVPLQTGDDDFCKYH